RISFPGLLEQIKRPLLQPSVSLRDRGICKPQIAVVHRRLPERHQRLAGGGRLSRRLRPSRNRVICVHRMQVIAYRTLRDVAAHAVTLSAAPSLRLLAAVRRLVTLLAMRAIIRRTRRWFRLAVRVVTHAAPQPVAARLLTSTPCELLEVAVYSH